MIFRRILTSLTLIVLGSAMGAAQLAQVSQLYSERDAYDVYKTVLKEERGASKLLIISSTTVSHNMCLEPDVDSNALVGPAIANFVEMNKIQWQIGDQLSIDLPHQLWSPLKIASATRDWSNFHAQYPDSRGIVMLSAVGFNADHSIAVVYKAIHCGELCGDGDFKVLQKTNGEWLPAKWGGRFCTWIS